MPNIAERIVARLRTEEDGSLSNQKVEQYALMRAEEVLTPWQTWVVTMSSGRGNTPSTGYQANVHKSPAFKRRLEALMEEKAQLQEGGVWGQLEWQARQLYRKCAAMNDPKGMQSATDTLFRVAMEAKKAAKAAEAPIEDEEQGEKRGRGAPAIETPLANGSVGHLRAKLVGG